MMILERLNRDYFNSVNRDLSKCEDEWSPLPEFMTMDFLKDMLERERDAVLKTELETDAEELKWEFFSKQLEEGKVVADMFCLYRVKNDLPKCPKCGASLRRTQGTLSRSDNKTMICSDCGESEILLEYELELLRHHRKQG